MKRYQYCFYLQQYAVVSNKKRKKFHIKINKKKLLKKKKNEISSFKFNNSCE